MAVLCTVRTLRIPVIILGAMTRISAIPAVHKVGAPGGGPCPGGGWEGTAPAFTSGDMDAIGGGGRAGGAVHNNASHHTIQKKQRQSISSAFSPTTWRPENRRHGRVLVVWAT